MRDDRGDLTGTRPIGIPAAIRRLANRVLMKHRSSDMCDLFTGRTADTRRLIVDGKWSSQVTRRHVTTPRVAIIEN